MMTIFILIKNTNDVVFVYEGTNGNFYCVRQKFLFEGNNWWPTDKTNDRLIENIPGFMIYYSYQLNIQP